MSTIYLIQKSPNSRYLTLAVVFMISSLLAMRPIGLGLDDYNYLAYFASAKDILLRYEGISLVFNEPLWMIISHLTVEIFAYEGSLRFIIFVSALFAGIGLGRINHWSLLPVVLYFALPLSLKNHIDHLRQGLALGLYIFLYSVNGPFRTLRLVLPLVHSSFWVVILIDLVVSWLLKKKIPKRIDSLKIFFIFGCVSVLFAVGMEETISALGFRQAEAYIFLSSGGSGVAFIGWFVLLPVFLMLSNQKYFVLFAAYLGFYLGGYFLNPIAARVFENSFFLICSAAPILSFSKRLLFGGILIVMCIAFGITGNLYPRLLGFSNL
jgi:hypothetical protein